MQLRRTSAESGEVITEISASIIVIMPFALCFPCVLIILYCLYIASYKAERNHIISGVEQTQAYITDSTFVLISPHLPIERARTTVPLANIFTVTTQGHSLWVNIKPTAPEVAMNSNQTSDDGAYLTYTTPCRENKEYVPFCRCNP